MPSEIPFGFFLTSLRRNGGLVFPKLPRKALARSRYGRLKMHFRLWSVGKVYFLFNTQENISFSRSEWVVRSKLWKILGKGMWLVWLGRLEATKPNSANKFIIVIEERVAWHQVWKFPAKRTWPAYKPGRASINLLWRERTDSSVHVPCSMFACSMFWQTGSKAQNGRLREDRSRVKKSFQMESANWFIRACRRQHFAIVAVTPSLSSISRWISFQSAKLP